MVLEPASMVYAHVQAAKCFAVATASTPIRVPHIVARLAIVQTQASEIRKEQFALQVNSATVEHVFV